MTALSNNENIIKGFQAGGADYISKPFNRDELLMRVKTHTQFSLSQKHLRDTIRTRDKLYSIIAHDIRSPFTTISMFIEALAEGAIAPNTSEFKDIMRQLAESTRETNTLLGNLLEWTRLQTGNIKLKPQIAKIHPVIDDCISLLKVNAANKKISIRSNVYCNDTALFDEITIHTVFRNLISNAIKFTPENGSITIETQQNGNYIAVKVKDTGIGMSQSVVHKIFDNNETFTSRGTQNEQGTGLGLKLVKDLVEQNNGTIKAESTEGIGTTITVELSIS